MLRPGIELGNLSDVGQVREENEDYFGYFEPEDDELFRRLGRLVIVADGMGGEKGGYTASRVAVDVIQETYFSCEPEVSVPEALRQALEEANRQVHQQGREPEYRGMGTTAVVLALLEETAYIAHVGDSRAYLVRGGEISQLTDDHTMVNRLVKAGALTPEEAEDHPEANVITRSIGSKPSVEVEVGDPLPLERGDGFVLCSDGLYSLVDDEEIAGTVVNVPPIDACSALVALANQRGGHDNVTIQVVVIGEWTGPSGPPRRRAGVTTKPPRGRRARGKGRWFGFGLGLLGVAAGLGVGLWYWGFADGPPGAAGADAATEAGRGSGARTPSGAPATEPAPDGAANE